MEDCRHLLKSSIVDSSRLPSYRSKRASEDLAPKIARLLKEIDEIRVDLEARYKAEAERQRSEALKKESTERAQNNAERRSR
jgi:hypothetical protein